jgi:hypothetical protein
MAELRTLLVSFDIENFQISQGFQQFLKDNPAWWHSLRGVWIIVTPLTASEVLANVKHYLTNKDRLLVMEVDLKTHKPSGWLSKDSHLWLTDPMAAVNGDTQKALEKPVAPESESDW